MNALTFNQVSLSPVTHTDNQIWITATELASALGYKKADAVTQIFNRNEDEFRSDMTQTLNLSVSGKNKGLQRTIRIFSLRGCHLVAMFAKTEVAKQFRKWVLDLIETEAQKFTGRTTTSDERTGLRDAINTMVSKKGMLYPEAYKLVHQRFNVEHIDELTLEQVGQATEYLYRLLLGESSKPSKTTASKLAVTDHEVYEIAIAAGNIQRMALMFETLEPALRIMGSHLHGTVRTYSAEYFARANQLIKIVNRLYPALKTDKREQLGIAIARLM